MNIPFYSKITNKTRFGGLMYLVSTIKLKKFILKINITFDLDIIGGANFYKSEDILQNSKTPQIIAKYEKENDKYSFVTSYNTQ